MRKKPFLYPIPFFFYYSFVLSIFGFIIGIYLLFFIEMQKSY